MPKLAIYGDGSKTFMDRRRARIALAHTLPKHTEFQWAIMRGICGYACAKCRAPDRDPPALHPDHILPVAKGGSDHIDNIQPLCESCNRAKSCNEAIDYRPSDWRETMLLLGGFDAQ